VLVDRICGLRTLKTWMFGFMKWKPMFGIIIVMIR